MIMNYDSLIIDIIIGKVDGGIMIMMEQHKIKKGIKKYHEN